MTDEMNEDLDVTPQYLTSHGFYRLEFGSDPGRAYFPEFSDDDLCFLEKNGSRQEFVVIMSPYSENIHASSSPRDYFYHVYVQEDAGCGYVEIPFPWTLLPIKYFEAVYFGITGKKPGASR